MGGLRLPFPPILHPHLHGHPNESLAEAVDNYDLPFTTDSANPWVFENTDFYYGGDAAVVQGVQDYNNSSLITQVNGPGVLSFSGRLPPKPDTTSSISSWTVKGRTPSAGFFPGANEASPSRRGA